MVSRDDVINAYRLILGREPESEGVIETHMSVQSLDELRKVFLSCPEYVNASETAQLDIESYMPPQDLPAIQVDCEATPEQLVSLLNRIRKEWEAFGKSEPHWSVLTHDAYKQSMLQENKGQFFQSGEFVTKILDAFSERTKTPLPMTGTCFELGCGVGRITMHLAKKFKNVVGVDISKYHLDICREELNRADINNVSLIALDDPESLKSLPKFDLFCSFIVLQHNPPPVITFLLDLILSKLEKGGLAVFQVPTYRRGYRFDLKSYLRFPRPLHMEMHVLPQEQIFSIIRRNNCHLIEIREDGWAEGRTNNCISNTFFVGK